MALEPSSVDIAKTYGALLIGGLFASLLSGLVLVQVVVYFRMDPRDSWAVKSLVLAVWILDTGHTAFIWSALWSYIIGNYGKLTNIDNIHWDVALTILLTAFLIFFVHIFLATRILLLSKRNVYLTAPIVLLAFLRLLAASVSTGEMLHLKTFSQFEAKIRWIFTTGLALSSLVDILITGSLFVLLHNSRADAPSLTAVIDALIRYIFETGSLTCAGTVISMICWLAMPHNLIFLGLHFVIGKLYANSLLVTLNTRETIRRTRRRSRDFSAVPVHIFDSRRQRVAAVEMADQYVMTPVAPSPVQKDSKISKTQTIVSKRVEVVEL